jgi:hypothetical protein
LFIDSHSLEHCSSCAIKWVIEWHRLSCLSIICKKTRVCASRYESSDDANRRKSRFLQKEWISFLTSRDLLPHIEQFEKTKHTTQQFVLCRADQAVYFTMCSFLKFSYSVFSWMVTIATPGHSVNLIEHVREDFLTVCAN